MYQLAMAVPALNLFALMNLSASESVCLWICLPLIPRITLADRVSSSQADIPAESNTAPDSNTAQIRASTWLRIPAESIGALLKIKPRLRPRANAWDVVGQFERGSNLAKGPGHAKR